MSFSEFVRSAQVDTGMKNILRSLMAKRKQEGFNGNLQDYIKKNYSGKDFALDVVYRGKKVIFNKD